MFTFCFNEHGKYLENMLNARHPFKDKSSTRINDFNGNLRFFVGHCDLPSSMHELIIHQLTMPFLINIDNSEIPFCCVLQMPFG